MSQNETGVVVNKMTSQHKMTAIVVCVIAVVVALLITYLYLGSQSHGKNSAPIVDGDITCTYNYSQWHCNKLG